MNERQSALFLFEEAMSYTYCAALRAVAELGIADHLSGSPRSATELAEATETDPGALHRVMRLLVSRGLFGEEGNRFHLTAKSSALCSNSTVPARSGVLMFTDQMFWATTHEITAILRAGQSSSFDQIFGMKIDDYFALKPETEELFYDGIEKVSEAENPLVAQSYDFPEHATVVDVGGRFGGFLLAALRAYPGLHGVLFDQDPMLRRHRLDVPDLAGRWETVSGDFFAEVPAADVYIIKRNLHALSDEDSIRVLRTCRRSLNPGGRVLVIDAIIPPGDTPHPSRCMDLMMLANHVGKERTRAELSSLFDAADLKLNRVIATPTPMSIAEGAER